MKEIGIVSDMIMSTGLLCSPVNFPQCYGGMGATLELDEEQMNAVLDDLYLNVQGFPEMTDEQALKDVVVTAEVYPSMNDFRAGLCRAYAYVPAYSPQLIPLQLCSQDQENMFKAFTKYAGCKTLKEFSKTVLDKTNEIVLGNKYDINENTNVKVSDVKIENYNASIGLELDNESKNVWLARTGLLDKCGYFAEEAVSVNKWLNDHGKTVSFKVRVDPYEEKAEMVAMITDCLGHTSEFSKGLNEDEYQCIKQRAEKYLNEQGKESYKSILNRCISLEKQDKGRTKSPMLLGEISSIFEDYVDDVTISEDPKDSDVTLITLGMTCDNVSYEFEPLRFHSYPIETRDLKEKVKELADSVDPDKMAVEIYSNMDVHSCSLRDILDDCEGMCDDLERLMTDLDDILYDYKQVFFNFEVDKVERPRISRHIGVSYDNDDFSRDTASFRLSLSDDTMRCLYENSSAYAGRYEDWKGEMVVSYVITEDKSGETIEGLEISTRFENVSGNKQYCDWYDNRSLSLDNSERAAIKKAVYEYCEKNGRDIRLEAKDILDERKEMRKQKAEKAQEKTER